MMMRLEPRVPMRAGRSSGLLARLDERNRLDVHRRARLGHGHGRHQRRERSQVRSGEARLSGGELKRTRLRTDGKSGGIGSESL